MGTNRNGTLKELGQQWSKHLRPYGKIMKFLIGAPGAAGVTVSRMISRH
jgi:hypothetical protein